METKIEITCDTADVPNLFGVLLASAQKDFEIKKRVFINKHIAKAVAALADDISKYLNRNSVSILKNTREDIERILEDHELRYQE